MKRVQGCSHFYVPINHSDAPNMGYQDLIAASELSGLLDLSTDPNMDNTSFKTLSSPKELAKKVLDKLTPGR
jgi:hypothetical protein